MKSRALMDHKTKTMMGDKVPKVPEPGKQVPNQKKHNEGKQKSKNPGTWWSPETLMDHRKKHNDGRQGSKSPGTRETSPGTLRILGARSACQVPVPCYQRLKPKSILLLGISGFDARYTTQKTPKFVTFLMVPNIASQRPSLMLSCVPKDPSDDAPPAATAANSAVEIGIFSTALKFDWIIRFWWTFHWIFFWALTLKLIFYKDRDTIEILNGWSGSWCGVQEGFGGCAPRDYGVPVWHWPNQFPGFSIECLLLLWFCSEVSCIHILIVDIVISTNPFPSFPILSHPFPSFPRPGPAQIFRPVKHMQLEAPCRGPSESWALGQP